jgi:hypothetical protein
MSRVFIVHIQLHTLPASPRPMAAPFPSSFPPALHSPPPSSAHFIHLRSQASLSLFVLMVSYIAQQRFRPFVRVKGLSGDLNQMVAALESKLAQLRKESAARSHRRASAGLSTPRRAQRSTPSTPSGGRSDGVVAPAQAAGATSTTSSPFGVGVASPSAAVVLAADPATAGPASSTRIVSPSPGSPTPSPAVSTLGGMDKRGSPECITTSPSDGKPGALTVATSTLTRVLRIMVFMVRWLGCYVRRGPGIGMMMAMHS